MMEDINKIFFIPGDLVEVKHDIPIKPKMVVSRIAKTNLKNQDSKLSGIVCYWFDFNGVYREQKFNTKDLIHSR